MPARAADWQAADYFNLGAGFKVLHSAACPTDTAATAAAQDGNTVATRAVGARTDFLVRYHYVGQDLAADFTLKVGQVINEILLDRVVIRLARQQPVALELHGHQHPVVPHLAATTGEFDGFALALAELLGDAQPGFGCPAQQPWPNAAAASAAVAVTLTAHALHDDRWSVTGAHLTGRSYAGVLEAETRHLGTPALTTTGWLVLLQETLDVYQQPTVTRTLARRVLARTVR